MSGRARPLSWWRRTIAARPSFRTAAPTWMATGCIVLAAVAGGRSPLGTIAAAAVVFSLKMICAPLVLWLLLRGQA